MQRQAEIQIQTQTHASKNSDWCSALKEREKISLGLGEVFLVRRWTDTCERDSQTHTAVGQVRDIQDFQWIEEGKTKKKSNALATQKGTLWFALLVAAPFFWLGTSQNLAVITLESVQLTNSSHSSLFLFLYSSIHSFIHSSNSSNSSNVSTLSACPAVKSLQSFSCYVLAKPMMTCDSQNFDQNVEQNFFLQISSDSQVHPTKGRCRWSKGSEKW